VKRELKGDRARICRQRKIESKAAMVLNRHESKSKMSGGGVITLTKHLIRLRAHAKHSLLRIENEKSYSKENSIDWNGTQRDS